MKYADLMNKNHNKVPVKTGIVFPCDEISLLSAVEAAEANIIDPLLVGPVDKIKYAADHHRLDISKYTILNANNEVDAARLAVNEVKTGFVHALMKGCLHTDEFMGAVTSSAHGIKTNRRLSHVYLLEVPTYHKMFVVTDAAINLNPTLEDKRDIVQNSIDFFLAIFGRSPTVALLSAVENITTRIPSTIDAAALCKMADRNQITGHLFIDGPFAFDNAISDVSAKIKKIKSAVPGDVDILVCPDLESANMLAKSIVYMANAKAAGLVLGARVPIILTSRADLGETRLTSCVLAATMASSNNHTN